MIKLSGRQNCLTLYIFIAATRLFQENMIFFSLVIKKKRFHFMAEIRLSIHLSEYIKTDMCMYSFKQTTLMKFIKKTRGVFLLSNNPSQVGRNEQATSYWHILVFIVKGSQVLNIIILIQVYHFVF